LATLFFQKITTKLARMNLAGFYKDLPQIFYGLLGHCQLFIIPYQGNFISDTYGSFGSDTSSGASFLTNRFSIS
jgi:phenylalanine-4-hydroxylase